MWGDVPDAITHVNFDVDLWFKGFHSLWVFHWQDLSPFWSLLLHSEVQNGGQNQTQNESVTHSTMLDFSAYETCTLTRSVVTVLDSTTMNPSTSSPFPWRFHKRMEKWQRSKRERHLSVDSSVDAAYHNLLAPLYQTGPVCMVPHQSLLSQRSCQTPANQQHDSNIAAWTTSAKWVC